MQDDTKAFLSRLRRITACRDVETASLRQCFDPHAPIHVARAPGRLDVMGGFADYSGSDALLLTTREACHAAVQCQSTQERPLLRVVSMRARVGSQPREFHLDMADIIVSDTKPVPLEHVRALVNRMAQRKGHNHREKEGGSTDASTGDGGAADEEEVHLSASDEPMDDENGPHWACYVVSCLVSLAWHRPEVCSAVNGKTLSVVVDSSVPRGQGASSSASLELATTGALIAATLKPTRGRDVEDAHCESVATSLSPGLEATGTLIPTIDYLTRARLCHLAEVFGVGAPCGAMDQIASACGRKDAVIRLSCRPAIVRGHVDVPPGIKIWAIASGAKRSVAGCAYAAARVGAFMGKTIIKEILKCASLLHCQDGTSLPRGELSSTNPKDPCFQSHPPLLDLLERIGSIPIHCSLPDEASHADNIAKAFASVLAAETKADSAFQALASLKGNLVSTEVPPTHWVERALSGKDFYLTELSSQEFDMFKPFLPLKCSGSSFAEKFPGGHGDEATQIDPLAVYPIRSATAHPVHENARAKRMGDLFLSCKSSGLPRYGHLEAFPAKNSARNRSDETFVDPPENLLMVMKAIGALMHASHVSYTACGLGCTEADKIVASVERSSRLFGARLSGGGAGGAVCIVGLDSREAQAEVRAIAAQFGRRSYIFDGSSGGAESIGEFTISRLATIS